jgi:small subunit ribosomal protein S2
MARAGASRGDDKPASGELATDEPLADWERELLEGATAGAPAAVEGAGVDVTTAAAAETAEA